MPISFCTAISHRARWIALYLLWIPLFLSAHSGTRSPIDGDTEAASKKYGPVTTPHVFIFDQQRKLRYNGRVDDTEDPQKTPRSQDTRNAVDALLNGTEVPVAVTKVFGCSVKWAEKSDWAERAAITWAKGPVKMDPIDVPGAAELVKNHTDRLRLINVWATWCGPCTAEFPELVTINRMYRDRGFELVSISMDDTVNTSKALLFLQHQQASSPNYIFTGDDKYKLIDALDPKCQGALPYSMLVEPGGKIAYAHQDGPQPRFHVLALYENGGYHIEYSRQARTWLEQLAADSNFTIDYIQNTDKIDAEYLKNYQLFIQLDFPPYAWKDKAVDAFRQYIEQGRGGWIGFHHATLLGKFDGYPMWEWFSQFMGGITYKNYIATFVQGEVKVEDRQHPVMKGVPDSFLIKKEEWYTYDKSPRPSVHVLASVDAIFWAASTAP